VHAPVDLGVVPVHADDQVVRLPVAGVHDRLPAVTLLQLAVSHVADDADVVLAPELGAQRHPVGHREPLAQ